MPRSSRPCAHDLPARKKTPAEPSSSHAWIASLIAAAVIVSSAAYLTVEFLKERKNWLS